MLNPSNNSIFSWRRLVAVWCLVVFPVLGGLAPAEDFSVLPKKIDGMEPRRMMHAYLMKQATAVLNRHEEQLRQIKTKQQLVEYQRQMRKFFIEQLGGLPEQRTPLGAKIVGRIDRPTYRVEKVIFESLPKHYVTAAMFLPDPSKHKPPYPAVLVSCGHSPIAKAYPSYQKACVLLAENGIAALIYDPIGQAERHGLLNDDGSPWHWAAMDHVLGGVSSTLVGKNVATYMVWDGMRGIDYLQSRDDIIAERIGAAGNSGGGLQTAYLMALDDRIVAAAPSCYITDMPHLLSSGSGPADGEQNIHAQITGGLGHGEYVFLRIPKPTLLCAAKKDYFPIAGTRNTLARAKVFYGIMDADDRVAIAEAEGRHGWSSTLRVAMVNWMRRWLQGKTDPIGKTETGVLSEKEIQCTPRGQVMLLPGARNLYDFNIDLEKQLAKRRKAFWTTTPKGQSLDEVRRIAGIRRLEQLPKPKCRKMDTIDRDGYHIDKLLVEPESGIWLPALAFVPKNRSGRACLVLHEEKEKLAATTDGAIQQRLQHGDIVLVVDLRGSGETQWFDTKLKHLAKYYGHDWQDVYLAYMLGRSYLGMRAEDVMVCARFLAGYEAGEKPNEVHLLAFDSLGPPSLHAAVLEPQLFASIQLQRSLTSWSNVVHTPISPRQLANAIHGVLRTYDLSDLVRAIAPEKITIDGIPGTQY